MSLRAGFSEIDITPALGLATAGSPASMPATGVHWRLYGRVAMFEDGTRRIAVVALDLGAIMPETTRELRVAMADAGGLAVEDILITCTHTHSGPRTVFLSGKAPDLDYLEQLETRLPEALAAAAASVEPVELRFGRASTDGVTFNRRPLYSGEQAATHGPMWIDDFLRLEGPADPELQLLLAVRPDGSTAGGLINFACHLHVMGLTNPALYSADVCGALSEELAGRNGGIYLFLQGASGNLAWQDMSAPPEQAAGQEPPANETVIALAERLADRLVDAAEAARSSSRPVGEGAIRVASRTLELAQRAPTAEQVDLATWFLKQDPSSVDLVDFNRRLYGHAYTFYEPPDAPSPSAWFATVSEWFALETVGMWWRNAFRPPPERVELQAIRIGDVALVGFPAEMFTEFGLRTKAESPFDHTVVCGLTNGWFGYIPTKDAFEHGGYEPRLKYSSRLQPEAGDLMTDAAVQLLHDLAQPR